MQEIAALSIDLDDTLWPIQPVIRAAEQRLYQWFEQHCPRVTEAYTQVQLDELRRDVMRRHPHRAHDFAFLRNEVIGGMLAAAGYSRTRVGEAYDVFLAARNEVELYADVEPELEWLSERYTLLAVTNGNADLEAIGLARFFRCTIRAADVGAPKPEPEIFAAAAAAAGVDPHRILHIGDAPLEDVTGAAQAGMRTAWLDRFDRIWPVHRNAPDLRISNLTELRGLLGVDQASGPARSVP